MDINDLREHLPLRIKMAGTNPSQLAQSIGLGIGAITDLLSGRVSRPRYDTLAAIARALNCSVEDLYLDPYVPPANIAIDDAAPTPPIDIRPGGNAEMAARISPAPHDLPLLGQAKAGLSGIFLGNGEPIAYIQRPPNLLGVIGAFAVLIRGESMIPRYYDGEVAHVNPVAPVRANNFVLIETVRHEAFVKQFVSRNSKFLIAQQFNPPITLEYAVNDVKNVYKITGSAESM